MDNGRSSSMPTRYLYIVLFWTATENVHTNDWNVALRKPAYQISTNCSGVASKATDGEEFVKFNDYTCSRTKGQSVTWWMVDLMGVFRIDQVQISNIGDYRSEWLANFSIDVFTTDPRETRGFPNNSGHVCYSHNGVSVGTQTLRANCSTKRPLFGRFVRIIKNNSMALVLCEVKVHSKMFRQRHSSYRQQLDPVVGLSHQFKKNYTRSKIQCAAWCSKVREQENCWAFSWFPEDKLCYLLAPEPLNSTIQGYELCGPRLYVEGSHVEAGLLDNC